MLFKKYMYKHYTCTDRCGYCRYDILSDVERFRLAFRLFDDVSTASWFTFSIPIFYDASEFSVCSFYSVFIFSC